MLQAKALLGVLVTPEMLVMLEMMAVVGVAAQELAEQGAILPWVVLERKLDQGVLVVAAHREEPQLHLVLLLALLPIFLLMFQQHVVKALLEPQVDLVILGLPGLPEILETPAHRPPV